MKSKREQIVISRIQVVLHRLRDFVSDNGQDADLISDALETFLDDFGDMFGTERQLDPRGDFRDGEWSMNHVQGVDE